MWWLTWCLSVAAAAAVTEIVTVRLASTTYAHSRVHTLTRAHTRARTHLVITKHRCYVHAATWSSKVMWVCVCVCHSHSFSTAHLAVKTDLTGAMKLNSDWVILTRNLWLQKLRVPWLSCSKLTTTASERRILSKRQLWMRPSHMCSAVCSFQFQCFDTDSWVGERTTDQ